MKKYRNRVLSLLVMCVLSLTVDAQSPQLIQYSGVVVSTDSAATPVPFASIYNRSIGLGTIANYMGFFSFAARIGDTIEVSSVGYMRGLVVVPAIPENQSYTAMIFLNPEVKTLPEARVYPWFSREQFRDAFVHLNIPDDDLERARKKSQCPNHESTFKECEGWIVEAPNNRFQIMRPPTITRDNTGLSLF
jgi:hypothetical protein